GSSFIVLGDNSEIVKKQDGTSLSGDSLDEVFSGVNEYVEQQGSTGASDGGGGSGWKCGDDITTKDGTETYTTKKMDDGMCWTTQNMRHPVMDKIPSEDAQSTDGIWYASGDSSTKDDYGLLYDWYTAMGLTGDHGGDEFIEKLDTSVCGQLGSGWQLPSGEERFAVGTGVVDIYSPGSRYSSPGENDWMFSDKYTIHWTASILDTPTPAFRRFMRDGSKPIGIWRYRIEDDRNDGWSGYSVVCRKE
ncbi:hypothetical protein, partial [Candidatus Vampirococcus lugosii]